MAVIEIFDTEEEQTQNRVEPKPAKTPKTTKTTKPRARTKKSAEAIETAPGASPDAPPAESAEKKPARKPRARKKPVEEASTDTLVVAEAAPAPEAAAVEEKPKRTRRGGKGRKRADAAEADTPETVASEVVVSEAAAPESAPPFTPSAETADTLADEAMPDQIVETPTSAAPADIAPALELPAAPELPALETSPELVAIESSPELPALESAPELTALEASPENPALESAPEQSALETSPRRAGLPVLTEFSPAPNAPKLVRPQASNAVGESSASGPSADADAASPSKSRSRSARRRKAARKRAEAAAAAQGHAGGTPFSETRSTSGIEIFDAEDDETVSTPFTSFTPESAPSETLDLFDAPNFSETSDTLNSPNPIDDSDSSAMSEISDTLEVSENPETSETPEVVEPAKSRRSRSRRGRGKKVAEKAAPETVIEPPSDSIAELDADADIEPDYDEDDEPAVQPRADRRMLVSVLPGELVEVVITDSGRVQEYYVEMEHQAKIRGNIYKGVVSNIDVNLQAAFVNYGNVKNGFLQIDEVHPEYWLTHHEVTKGHKYPPIQKVMKPGQEVLVQVVKEPNGAKGAFLTTWVSLAGRFLVLTPGQEQIGISRKVEDGEERNRLRELIKGLNPGEGLGAIVRTVSAGTSKTTLQKDLSFLKRVWKDIRKRAGTEKAPSLIYKEPSLATRAVRDYLSDDVSEIWVDDAETADAIRDMTSLLFPRKADLLHLYQDNSKTLWERFKVRKDLDQIHAREVYLPSGGRLVFDQTEALMAIDINSGKTGGKTNFESMALRTNVEAAEMIAHQLRLRDIGGQVVIDFIEMRDQSHCREVEKVMRNAMKGDRARYDIGKMSSFGLMQIVRQRIGSSAISISQEPCPHCTGTGLRRNMEWQSLQVLRDLRVQLRNASVSGQTEFLLQLESELAVYILNHKRERLCALEKEFGVRLEIHVGLDKAAA